MKRMTPAVNASICLAKSVTAQSVSDREAYEIARDTYVYAHPAMLMDVFMRQGTNYASVPATDRYLMLPQLSLWTDVFRAGQAHNGRPRLPELPSSCRRPTPRPCKRT